MFVRRLLALAVLGATIGAVSVPAAAQTLRDTEAPAEFPPASYKGRQYVDSRGCVFIRAGVDGTVNWVPRVTRGRKVVCGFKPSLAGKATPPAEPAPKPAVQEPVEIAKKAVPPPAKPATRPEPRKAATAAPTPHKTRTTRHKARRPAPQKVVPLVRSRQPGKVFALSRHPACKGGSALSNHYINDNSRGPVRCGPQAESPVSGNAEATARSTTKGAPAGYSRATGTIASNAVIVPRHVYEKNRKLGEVRVPAGYKKAWDDDRLNDKRAYGTIKGRRQMDLVWTATVPRRLIDRNSGRDVTARFPKLLYPFTDAASQKAYLAKQRASAANTANAPAPHRYVQVGTFGVAGNAQRTAARLQKMGLPVRMTRYAKGGKSYRVVLAGPFGSKAQVQSALTAARRSGFSDAFARN